MSPDQQHLSSDRYIDENWIDHIADQSLRLLIHKVHEIANVDTVLTGRVYSGTLKPGMNLTITPALITTEVDSIQMHHCQLDAAMPGDYVGFKVKNVSVKDIKRGMVVSDTSNDSAGDCESFIAQIAILYHPTVIHAGYSPVLPYHTTQIPVKFDQIPARMDKRTLNTLEESPSNIQLGDIARIKFTPLKPLCIETFGGSSRFRYPGRLIFRDMGRTIGVGLVTSVVKTNVVHGKPAAVPGTLSI